MDLDSVVYIASSNGDLRRAVFHFTDECEMSLEESLLRSDFNKWPSIIMESGYNNHTTFYVEDVEDKKELEEHEKRHPNLILFQVLYGDTTAYAAWYKPKNKDIAVD